MADWEKRVEVEAAKARYWAWQLIAKGVFAVLYLGIISEGLRIVVPPLGQRLSKIPMLAFLGGYEETHRLDLAPFLALFLLIAVLSLWTKLIQLWIGIEHAFQRNGSHYYLHNHKVLVVGLATIVLSSDCYLFYSAMLQMSWSGSVISIPALVATAAYMSVLIFVTYQGVLLGERVHELKERSR